MDELDDTAWVLELESALEDEAYLDQRRIRQICKLRTLPDHLRTQVWKVSLGLENSRKHESSWDEMYNLQEQALIRQDCQKLVEKLGNEGAEKLSVLCDLESVVTRFVKQSNLRYEVGNGWMALLEPLVALRLNKEDLYGAFYNMVHRFVPRSCFQDGDARFGSAAFHLMRLLLQYHDPEICSFLESKKVVPEQYAWRWLASVFSESCDLAVTQSIWDIYLQICDPFLVFYLALVLLVNLRDQILASKTEPREKIVESISSAPCALNADDVEDFCQLAHFYSTKTPPSIYASFRHSLFGLRTQSSSSASPATSSTSTPEPDHPTRPAGVTEDEAISASLAQVLCLPVPPSDLLLNEAQRMSLPYKSLVRYFVVDCRPAEQYNAGHLKTAFHLDASLMLSEPTAYSIAVQALFTAQKHMVEAGKAGEHICFMGSGREEEDQYVNMVVASFLQKQVTYISQVRGGYSALHDLISEESHLDEYLTDHNPQQCIQCASSNHSNKSGSNLSTDTDESKESTSFFSRFRQKEGLLGKLKLKLSSAQDLKEEFKGLMIGNSTPIGGPINPERHVSSGDKLGKRYRAADSMFTSTSIDDDDLLDDGGCLGSDASVGAEEVSVEAWKHKSDVLAHYECEELRPGAKTLCPNCHLLISRTHLFVLRELSSKKNFAHIVARRPLVSIVKITSKKSHPELITFKYGYCPSPMEADADEGEPGKTFQITGSDVLFIPRAADAIKLVKMQVMRLIDEIENSK
ncbi:TBC1 domain family member 23-like isoform X3 [Varroa jacobsoni]|uniref:TBC1 domain family member 23 n=1 Tax=Varroa destructor TaxID=109461 RepID=A0A7M7M935_VARDE|nr:TBC1 domain family member 23-like isoform X2 [Varroa destructor]XP_022701020.1 TBC1 domain family member 23-like isoform X3 [Varroa jacobsoni]